MRSEEVRNFWDEASALCEATMQSFKCSNERKEEGRKPNSKKISEVVYYISVERTRNEKTQTMVLHLGNGIA